jgi:hypothetical protein
MAGFRKAKAEQASLKLGLYGLAGSGKTFTALLIAEGLANLTKKRAAFVDSERGTDFYSQAVKDRAAHPAAFDFDALYTRSITEVLDAVKSLDPAQHAVVVIDSITHIWDACKNSYAGKMTKIGTLPFHAWAAIKKPYRDLMNYLLSSPMHVIICGRQGNVFEEDEETGEMKKVGEKMKAEGETPYEPHILIHMMNERQKDGTGRILAFAEKDRTGVLAGKTIVNPDFDSLVKPLLPLLGNTQAQIQGEDEVASVDAERLASQDQEREMQSQATLDEIKGRIMICKSLADLKEVGKAITPDLKKGMIPAHVAELREAYLAKEKGVR